MKAEIITWEFPPFIAGGMGMACYGLAKALLELGVDVDLLLPTTSDVYFEFRRPEDADIMPMRHFDAGTSPQFREETIANLKERLVSVGVSSYPETYLTPGASLDAVLEQIWETTTRWSGHAFDAVRWHLGGHENLFKKVREFTARIMRNAGGISCDVIHVHDWLTYPAGMLLKEILKKPMVAHIHATEFDRAGGPGDRRIHDIEYAGLTGADLVIAVSQYTAKMISERYLIDPRKIRVIHNAYSLSAEAEMKKEKIFKDPLVLFLGRITIQKGPDYFLKVAKKVLDKNPRVRFVMAGSGDMFSRLLRASASNQLKDRFLFAGFLNREQVEKILAVTDIFVLPSVSEPFGIAPLEAMAFGATTIVSKQSGVSEVIKNAYKVDFWDVDKMAGIIMNLLNKPEEKETMSKAGKDEVCNIGWIEAAKKTRRAYEEAICSM